MTFTQPTVTWLKDGVVINILPTNADPENNGALESLLEFTFTPDGAGDYQCLFTDTVSSEIFVTHPVRLDTGKLRKNKQTNKPYCHAHSLML